MRGSSHFSKNQPARGCCLLAEASGFEGDFVEGYSIPSSFHFLSTSVFVFSSIRISSGHGRVNPSVGHLRVASIPIFEPKFARREA